MDVHVCNPSIQEVEAGGSRNLGHIEQHQDTHLANKI